MDEEGGDSELPRVGSTEDFELCRVVRDRGRLNATLSAPAPVLYEALNPSTPIKGLLSNWETLYVQFRDEEGMLSFCSPIAFCSLIPGNLLPVQVSQPTLLDEEDEEPRRAPPIPESPLPVGKGKRKAPPE